MPFTRTEPEHVQPSCAVHIYTTTFSVGAEGCGRPHLPTHPLRVCASRGRVRSSRERRDERRDPSEAKTARGLWWGARAGSSEEASLARQGRSSRSPSAQRTSGSVSWGAASTVMVHPPKELFEENEGSTPRSPEGRGSDSDKEWELI
eukprot:9135249-Pyramimonas_sp.AAC.1